jgi:hypothetical protein
MEENCIGSQSPQRTVVLEKKNNNEVCIKHTKTSTLLKPDPGQ